MYVYVAKHVALTFNDTVHIEGDWIQSLPDSLPTDFNEQKAQWGEICYVNPLSPEAAEYFEYNPITAAVDATLIAQGITRDQISRENESTQVFEDEQNASEDDVSDTEAGGEEDSEPDKEPEEPVVPAEIKRTKKTPAKKPAKKPAKEAAKETAKKGGKKGK